jgi:hypothetical protein
MLHPDAYAAWVTQLPCNFHDLSLGAQVLHPAAYVAWEALQLRGRFLPATEVLHPCAPVRMRFEALTGPGRRDGITAKTLQDALTGTSLYDAVGG